MKMLLCIKQFRCVLESDFETICYIIFICLPAHLKVIAHSVRLILMKLGKLGK
jgi:hypothetical protein